MIVYVALGAGRGHATRAAAVCRHLDNAATIVRDLACFNEPIEAAQLGLHIVNGGQTIEALLELLDPSLVVWDAGGATPALSCPVVYVWRHGRAAEPFGDINVSIDWPPPAGFEDFWPILSVDRFASRTRARQRLDVDDEHVTLVLDSASHPYDTRSEFTGPLEAKVVEWARWPAADVLRGADVVVGAAGCNLWSEVHHLGLAAEWVALKPDQELRCAAGPAPMGQPDRSADLATLILNVANESS